MISLQPKIRHCCVHGLAVVAATWGSVGGGLCLAEPLESVIALPAAQFQLNRMGPDMPFAFAAFDVDDTATIIHLQIGSNRDGLPIDIWPPTGPAINETTITGLGGEYAAFETTGADANVVSSLCLGFSGFQYHYLFPSQGAGVYEVQFGPIVGLTEEVGLISSMITDSAVGANLFTTDAAVPLGSSVVLHAAVFEGASGVLGASVPVSIETSGSDEVVVALADDGIGADVAVGDGLYSGVFTPQEIGEYRAVAEITGTTTGGANFTRTTATTFVVTAPCAALNGPINDYGVDDDANGLYERLVVQAEVDSGSVTTFGLFVTLETPTGQLLTGQGQAELPTGQGPIEASIDAPDLWAGGENGPYTIRTLELICYGPDGPTPGDRWMGLMDQTEPYELAEFEKPPLWLTATGWDATDDADSDGDLDTLWMVVGIQAAAAGDYAYSARLVDPCMTEIGVITGQQDLPGGSGAILILEFNGSLIGLNGVDGPYSLSHLSVWGQGASLYKAVVRETDAYAAAEFDSYTVPADCNDNGSPDSCDLNLGTSADSDFSGIPDECEPQQPCAERYFSLCADDDDCIWGTTCITGVCYMPKSRYLPFVPNNDGASVAFQVELTASEYFPGSVGSTWWVTEPVCTDNDGNPVASAPPCDGDNLWVSQLTSTPPPPRVWDEDVVHIGDCAIVPAASYEIRATLDEIVFSDPLALGTPARPGIKCWGDIVGGWDGRHWSGPNQAVTMDDIMAVLFYFQGQPNKPPRPLVDMEPEAPNTVVNMTDVLQLTNAFKGDPYPFAAPADCP